MGEKSKLVQPAWVKAKAGYKFPPEEKKEAPEAPEEKKEAPEAPEEKKEAPEAPETKAAKKQK